MHVLNAQPLAVACERCPAGLFHMHVWATYLWRKLSVCCVMLRVAIVPAHALHSLFAAQAR
jgi:hypothetical protein